MISIKSPGGSMFPYYLKIWVDGYKTSITDRVISEFINNLCRMSLYIERLAIVGSRRG